MKTVSFIGPNIRYLRRRKGLTQDWASNQLDMPRSTLSGYENGVAQPPLDMIIKISEYFEISVDSLLKLDLTELHEKLSK
jgi:transcriptional regulator with XRE-family HTH domain